MVWSTRVNKLASRDAVDNRVFAGLKASLMPQRAPQCKTVNSLKHAYSPLTPSEECVIPPLLAPFYADYGADTYFTCKSNHLVFFSRNEMMRRRRELPDGCVDIARHCSFDAMTYVHTCMKFTGRIITMYGDEKYREIILQEILDGLPAPHTDVVIHRDIGAWWDFYDYEL